MLDILSHPGPTMVGPGEKVFKTEVLGWMENAMLNLAFPYNRAMILIFKEEFAEFADFLLDIPLHPESTKDSPWLGPVINIRK